MDEAIKCRYCGEFLKDNLRQIVGQKPQWYFKNSTLIVGFLFIGPLIIPLVWINPFYSVARKALLTVVLLAISVALIIMLKTSLVTLSEYYQILQGNIPQ